jgi:hypothetical protein
MDCLCFTPALVIGDPVSGNFLKMLKKAFLLAETNPSAQPLLIRKLIGLGKGCPSDCHTVSSATSQAMSLRDSSAETLAAHDAE